MAVTKEEGGQLNTFAKEPRIQVLSENSSNTKGFQLLLVSGIALLIALIAVSLTTS